MHKMERINNNLEDAEFKTERGKLWMQNRRKMGYMRDGIVKYHNFWDAVVKIMKE